MSPQIQFIVANRTIRVLPELKPEPKPEPQRRFYSLFSRTDNGNWRQCRTVNVDMATAYRIWGDDVILSSGKLSIRRSAISLKSARG